MTDYPHAEFYQLLIQVSVITFDLSFKTQRHMLRQRRPAIKINFFFLLRYISGPKERQTLLGALSFDLKKDIFGDLTLKDLYDFLQQHSRKRSACVFQLKFVCVSTCAESLLKTQSILAFMAKHFQVPTEITKKRIRVHIKIYESNFSI